MMALAARFDAKRIESEARRHLEGLDVQGLLRGSGRERVAFIEGPPTMNGPPHAGHLRGRVIKDLWYRFSTLQGKHVEFNGGWDTQGLPVELQAERELGATGGKAEAIREFGIEGIVAECKSVVGRHIREWAAADGMLGVSLDHSRAYSTLDDGYIEREWQVLRRAHESGILEEDHTVIAYCPSCQTSLSHAEVGQGYEEVRDPSLYYKVRLADEDAYLIVWTTMPFTLVTDAMVGLNPDEEYVRIRCGGEAWIVGRTRLEEFAAEAQVEYEVEGTARGSDFEGRAYVHPLLDLVPGLAERAAAGNFHFAASEGFVDVTAGSGLVHLSPANGEEDIRIANRRGVAVFCPIDDEARFTAPAGRYAGMYVRDADSAIVDDLRERGALVRIGRIRHKYPLCWRSRHPVVWLARRGWFYKLDRLGGRAVDAAGAVEYFFEQPRNRFLGIVGERHPWCISRERVWGCPLPVWDCAGCGARTWLFSRQEIVDAASELPDGPGFELHRPWIDRVRIRCGGCGGTDTRREEYVLDTWHNSGAAPFASLGDAGYRDGIPAPFFTEGIDQTRGWAYTLLVENVILSGRPEAPYRSFLFQGHVLDSKGGKMSKSRGNVIGAAELLERHPADLVRFYFVWKASPIEPLSFDTKEMMSRPYQVLSTLYNLHLYLAQNSGYDGYDASHGLGWAAGEGLLRPPDVWLLSKLRGVIARVTECNTTCRFHEAARALEDYIINVLSQAYVPIVRAELWEEEGGQRRTAIYAVLHEVLRALDIMLHPVCPFTSEHLYQAVFGGRESILLERWPDVEGYPADAAVEESFDIMREVVSVAAAARMRGRMKRRWPLDAALVCVRPGEKAKAERLSELLRSQLNVERLEVHECSAAGGLGQVAEMEGMGLPARGTVGLDRKSVGPKARERMAELLAAFEAADPADIIASLRGGSGHDFVLDGATVRLDGGDLEVGLGAADGYEVASRDGRTVFVSTARSAEMEARGLLRDVARRLQALRKERGHSPTDVLGVASVLGLDAGPLAALRQRAAELAFLVRVERVDFEGACKSYKDEEIDGQSIRIGVE